MSEEEKKAIEELEDEIFELEFLSITKEDIKKLEDFLEKTDVDYDEYGDFIISDIAENIIKNLIQSYRKQQKEIEELKIDNDIMKQDLNGNIVYKDEIEEIYIQKQKIKDKIEEISNMINYLKQFGHTSRLHELRVKKRVLQELLNE